MPDLIVYLPSHGYSDNDALFISWLDGIFYVDDKTTNSFKLTNGASGPNLQFISSITDGFIRRDTLPDTTIISGLEHLEGELVTVTSNGNMVGSDIVASGQITLLSSVTSYQVGLAYTCKIRSMRLAVPQDGNALQGTIKRISRTITRYSKTKNGKVGQEYPVTNTSGSEIMTEFLEDMGAVFDKDSRDVIKPVKGGMATEGYVVHKSELPSPMTIIANIVDFSLDETR